MNQIPRISVLIPTYNYARYLSETVQSVLDQHEQDYEVLIVDDASVDDTANVCSRLAALDPRIRVHRHERNLGMVPNWNWCLHHARGRYVKYLLADDKLNHPDALGIMAEELDRNPRVVLVTCARQIIDETSVSLDISKPLGHERRILTGEWITRRYLDRDSQHINSIGEPSAVMFRREKAQRGFDEQYRQLVDLEMWLHLLQDGDLAYVPRPLCCFRKHADQQSEVNKLDHVHPREEVELCLRYSHPDALKRVLFDKMYRFSKRNGPEYQQLVKRIRDSFTPRELIFQYIRYKMTRPFINLKRSVAKRMDQ